MPITTITFTIITRINPSAAPPRAADRFALVCAAWASRARRYAMRTTPTAPTAAPSPASPGAARPSPPCWGTAASPAGVEIEWRRRTATPSLPWRTTGVRRRTTTTTIAAAAAAAGTARQPTGGGRKVRRRMVIAVEVLGVGTWKVLFLVLVFSLMYRRVIFCHF